MHSGKFPTAPSSPSAQAYVPGTWSTAELEPQAAQSTRRQWMVGVFGLVAGASITWGVGAATGGAVEAKTDTSSETALPETPASALPEWALKLETAPAEDLLRWAGDLEKLSRMHRMETRLVPTFERLLDTVLTSEGQYVDMAGACAVRGLDRLGRADSVQVRRRKLMSRSDLVETRSVADQLLADLAARRTKEHR